MWMWGRTARLKIESSDESADDIDTIIKRGELIFNIEEFSVFNS